LQLEADLRGLAAEHGSLVVTEHHTVGGTDLRATNTRGAPDRVVARRGTGATVRTDCLHLDLAPASWTALQLRPTNATGENR
jgi:alpha-L-arabinofuranosidase